MRILLATRAFPPDQRGSAASLLHELWDRLREEHDLRLISGWTTDPTLLPGDAVAVRSSAGASLKARGAMEVAVRRTALTFRPDVVLAFGMEVPTDVAPTVGLLGDPFAGANAWGRLAGLRRRLWKQRVGAMSIAVVPTDSARKRLAEFGVDGRNVRVCWPGIDTSRLCPDPAIEVLPRAGTLRIVCPGRMLPGKAQHVAIEAVKGLNDRLRDRIQLDLVGPATDPDYVATLRRRAKGMAVTFHHDVPDIAPHLRSAHLVVVPTTRDEPFGFSLLEAMACGKPVITSKSGPLRELTGDIGVRVPPGDVKQLGMAIRSLLRDPARLAELGTQGRELVVERYAWSNALPRFESLLQEAAR